MAESSLKIVESFSELIDPRIKKKTDHLLIDIIVIMILAVICGANNFVEIEVYGKSKKKWLESFLELPHGIPSHDTFGRVLSLLSPKSFQKCFLSWVQSVAEITEGEIIPIDGKCLRRSHDRSNGKKAIHMVSAWSTKNKIVLGQVKTDSKSNEITAIPKLLEILDLQNRIVTIDAMGCQTKITEKIIEKEGDYVISLKGNQGILHKNVEQFFLEAKEKNFEGTDIQQEETVEKDHGRLEIRRYSITSDLSQIEKKKEWKGLNVIGMVESERHFKNKLEKETRYFIGSIQEDVTLFQHAVRDHWQIETSLHWRLDVVFREDESRVRKDHAPENLAMIRHLALNLLQKETSVKTGTQAKRMRAAWDDEYLLKVLHS